MIGLKDVFRDPEGTTTKLADGALWGIESASVRWVDTTCVVFWVTLTPWPQAAREGYPVERVSITVWRDGKICAVPPMAWKRRWLHRNAGLLDTGVFVPGAIHGELCLWYERDVPALKWDWSKGLEAYVTVVHRHLMAEEHWRRTDRWPAEDAPHGERSDGSPHPVCSVELQRLVTPVAR